MTNEAATGGWDLSGVPWPVVLGFGILSIGVGVLAIVWPDITVFVLTILFGVQLIFFGIMSMIGAFSGTAPGGEAALLAIGGILGLLIGILVLAQPLRSALILAVVLGAYWLVWGIIELIASVFGRDVEGRWWAIGSGALSVVAGVIALSWPGMTLLALAWVAGLWMIVMGAARIGIAVEIRRAAAIA